MALFTPLVLHMADKRADAHDLALDCTIRRPETIAMMIAVPVIHSYRERSQACPS